MTESKLAVQVVAQSVWRCELFNGATVNCQFQGFKPPSAQRLGQSEVQFIALELLIAFIAKDVNEAKFLGVQVHHEHRRVAG